MISCKRILLATAIAAQLCTPVLAADAPEWIAAFRYRFEQVDDDAFGRDAEAHTARLRLGWQRAWDENWRSLIEAEGVAELSDDFNSTANGETSFPVVADPRAFELNQAWLGWSKGPARVSAGRQRLNLDNQRFIGSVGWRQNEQTFDAVSMGYNPNDKIQLRYDFLDRVHRINGGEAINPLARERNLNSHLLNASFKLPLGTLVGYSYLLKDNDVASTSTVSSGLRWVGSVNQGERQWGWTLELATQSDYADNPNDLSHGYLLVEPKLSWHGITWKLGYERLEGDGQTAFQTPLATLHAFNGWADKFLNTPADGLEDWYVGADGKFGSTDRWSWAVVYHDFGAENRSTDYGSEWDASLGMTLGAGWKALLKFADYQSDGFSADTSKWWLQFEWNR